MSNFELEEIKRLIRGAMKEKNVISFTRKDYACHVSCQERYVVSISESEFVHTTATSNSKATSTTAFEDVHSITVSNESMSGLKRNISFKFSKLDEMMKQGDNLEKEKQPHNGGIRPMFIDNRKHPSYKKQKTTS
jgi:hypothetical protein